MNFNALEAKVEQRLSHGVSLLFGYTHSKLIDDASSVFSSTVLSSPNSRQPGGSGYVSALAGAGFVDGRYAECVDGERDVSVADGTGHSFASTGAGIFCWEGGRLMGFMSLQSGMPVTVTQATNNLAYAGFVPPGRILWA